MSVSEIYWMDVLTQLGLTSVLTAGVSVVIMVVTIIAYADKAISKERFNLIFKTVMVVLVLSTIIAVLTPTGSSFRAMVEENNSTHHLNPPASESQN